MKQLMRIAVVLWLVAWGGGAVAAAEWSPPSAEKIRASLQERIASEDRGPQEASEEKVQAVEAGERAVANASWWGFDEADATEILQQALDSGAEVLIIPRMESKWITRPLFLRSDQTVLFEDGAVVEAKRGEFHGRNDSLFEGRFVENVTLIGYGATLQMHKEDYRDPDQYQPAEWRMVLMLRSVKDMNIYGLTLRGSGGDGIYVGRGSAEEGPSYCENVHIKDVVCDDNYRQGISVISARNLLIENTVLRGTEGTGPAAGIDLEPNRADEEMHNVVIRNCIFEDNQNLGMHMWMGHLSSEARPISVVWESNYVRGSRVGIHVNSVAEEGVQGTVTYRNNIVEASTHQGILIRQKGAGSVRLIFENNMLYNVSSERGRQYAAIAAPIVLAAQGDRPERQGGIEFRNTFVYSDRIDKPVLVVEGADGFDEWTDVTGEITASVPGGARSQIEQAGEDFTLTVNER